MAGLKIHSNREYIDSSVIGLSLRHAISLTDLSLSLSLSFTLCLDSLSLISNQKHIPSSMYILLQIYNETFYTEACNYNIYKGDYKMVI